MIRIYPSLISANLLNLEHEIKLLEPHCDGFHLDIMDNHFVPNLTFGIDMIQAISKTTHKQLWVHLMVDQPNTWIESLQLPEQTILSFHIESTNKTSELIKRIKEKKWLTSIAINPKTNVDEIFPYLHLIDQVLIMSVEPGFSGQRFLEPTIDKIAPLIKRQTAQKLTFSIGFDGGITPENIGLLAQKGVTDFAAASTIFNNPHPIEALEQLRKRAKR